MTKLTGHYDGCGLTELCLVRAVDEPHPINGAYHHYTITRYLTVEEQKLTAEVPYFEIRFQCEPRDERGSIPGILDGALLSVLIHRFECFQEGPFECGENAAALHCLYAARNMLIKRAQERKARGVLGKHEK